MCVASFIFVKSCNSKFVRYFVFLAVGMLQASPITINGRQAVVEEKRSTNRGKFLFMDLTFFVVDF